MQSEGGDTNERQRAQNNRWNRIPQRSIVEQGVKRIGEERLGELRRRSPCQRSERKQHHDGDHRCHGTDGGTSTPRAGSLETGQITTKVSPEEYERGHHHRKPCHHGPWTACRHRSWTALNHGKADKDYADEAEQGECCRDPQGHSDDGPTRNGQPRRGECKDGSQNDQH